MGIDKLIRHKRKPQQQRQAARQVDMKTI